MNIKKLTQKDRYGNMVSFEFDVPPMESIPHPGMPIGTDTVPAWLTPGERVMNAEAERMYGPVLKQMNDDGRALQRAQGGTIPEYAAMGCKVKYKSQGGPVYAADGIPVTQGEGFIPFDQMPGFAHIRSPEAEGFRPDVYDDPIKGSAVPTVGYGHKLLPEEIEAVRKGKKYTQEELEQLYLQDYLRAQQDARNNIPGFNEMTPEMQGAFTSQAFQLGGQGQADFDQMIAAIDAGDKGKAIQEVYNSDWAKQTPKRAEYLAKAIQEGSLQQAKSAVEGEMVANVEQETGRMTPTGYLNTDIFDEGGKFAPSAIPPLPQSGPIKPETAMERRARVMKDADEQFADAQKIRQGTYKEPSVAGGRGNVVEQAGERANALRSTSVDPYMAEEVPPVVKKEQSFFDWLTTPQDKTLGKQLDEKLGIDFGNDGVPNQGIPERVSFLAPLVDNVGKTEYTEKNKVELPKIGTVKPEMSEALAEQEKAMAARAEGTQPTYGLDVGVETYAEDDAMMEEKGAPPVPRDIAGQQGVIDKTAEQVENQNIIDEFRERNPYSNKSNKEILEEQSEPPNVKENTVTSITEQTKGEESPADNNVDPNAVVNKGEDIVKTDPEAASKVKSFLDEWGITDLFNKKEVGRMIATYLGSRALGYSHGGSLNFAAKNYMTGVDKINTVADKLVLENKHTKESIEEYRNTGDMSALITKPASPIRTSGKPNVYYDNTSNNKINLYEWKDKATGNTYLGDAQGTPFDMSKVHDDPSRVPDTKEFEERIFKYKADTTKDLKDLESRFGVDADDKPITNIPVNTAAGETARWAVTNNIAPEKLTSITESAYRDAIAYQQRVGDGYKVSDIRPFLNQQVLRTYTDSPNTFLAKGSTLEKPVFIDSRKLSNVNEVVARQLGVQYEDARVSDIANKYINSKEEEWYSLNQETIKDKDGNDIPNPNYNPKLFKQFEDAANDDENGFLLFIQKDLGIDDGRIKN